MQSPADPQRVALPLVPELSRAEWQLLAREWLAWSAWSACAVLVLAAVPAWDRVPHAQEVGVGVVVALGLWAAHPRSPWAPVAGVVVVAGTVGAALGLGLSPAWVAGGLAAGMAGKLCGSARHALLQAVLAGLVGVGLAVVTARSMGWVPYGSLIGAGAACGLLPLRLSWRPVPPPEKRIRKTLAVTWREPALRGSRLHGELIAQRPPPVARRGLSEVACWVYRLALTLQRLEHEALALPENEVHQRLEALLEEVENADDLFLRERRLATVGHYRHVLDQVGQVQLELQRLRSLQEYALAYLEEARLGLVLARTIPGTAIPDRLDEVLGRLRTDASEARVLRRTRQEIEICA